MYAPKNYLRSFLVASLCFLSTSLIAQEAEEETYTHAHSTMLSVGHGKLLDTYLTQNNYSGLHFGIQNELIAYYPINGKLWANQIRTHLDFTKAQTRYKQGRYWEGMVSFMGTSYRMYEITPDLRLGVGPALGMHAGFIYNLRGGNNPATAKLGISAGVGGMATYTLRIKKYPIYLRHQMTLPALSVFFAPQFGQSYYEIFTLGNHKGTTHIGFFHNYFEMDHFLTADLPLGKGYIRVGYNARMLLSNEHYIKTRIISHDFVIGYTREFVPFSRRKAKRPEQYINPLF